MKCPACKGMKCADCDKIICAHTGKNFGGRFFSDVAAVRLCKKCCSMRSAEWLRSRMQKGDSK